MRLISARIENFGKLHQVSFDFVTVCQVFCEKNGWGKSTLASFLCTMFFGFGGEKKRDDKKNERKRYQPWQKGVYGGSVVFEAKGIQYEMSRIFGQKESEDEFCLRRKESHVICNDFSKNIGEELFGIDREAFLRTVYISQLDCETTATDTINAKIGNLIENNDDVNRYEKAINLLKNKGNYLRPDHKKGHLNKLQEEIWQIENDVREEDRVRREMEEASAFYQNQKNSLLSAEKEMERLEERQYALSSKRDEDIKVSRDERKRQFLLYMALLVLVIGGVFVMVHRGMGVAIIFFGVFLLLAYLRKLKKGKQEKQSCQEQTIGELLDNIRMTRGKRDVAQQKILECEQDLKTLQERWEHLCQQKDELKQKKEMYEKEYQEYRMVCKTMEMLQLAKERLLSKYVGPLQRNFGKYFERISEHPSVDYQYDADVNMWVYEQGMRRDVRFLSVGNRDLLGICTRFALIDAMYQEEPPFLILDDPFVNLDEETTEKAKQLLDDMSKTYQVIYFTCHKSRA